MKPTSILVVLIALFTVIVIPAAKAETFGINAANSTGEAAEGAKIVATSQADFDKLADAAGGYHFYIPGFYWVLNGGSHVIPGPGFTVSDGRSNINYYALFARDNPKKAAQIEYVLKHPELKQEVKK